MPRVALAGNNLAAVYTLDLLLEALEPAEVLVIAPGRSERRDWQESLDDHAKAAGVESLTPSDVNEGWIADQVIKHDPVLFLSVYYTQIFRGVLLEAIEGRALNFHPSLLPRHRGTAPLMWAIIDGDARTGLSVHRIDAGIDTGNLVAQRSIPIHHEDTGFVLHRKMAKLVRATAAEIIRDLLAGKQLPIGSQQSGESSVHTLSDPRVNHIDWSDSRERIRNVVRALAPPLPGAFAMTNGEPLIIARVDPAEATPISRPKAPGMVEFRGESSPIVWAGDGPLQLTTVFVDDMAQPGNAVIAARQLTEGQVLR